MDRLLAALLLAALMLFAPALARREADAPAFFSMLFPQLLSFEEEEPADNAPEAGWGERMWL